MHKCMSRQQPKLVYVFWTCKPVVSKEQVFCHSVFMAQQAQIPTALVLDFDKLDCPPREDEVI